jgi:hypothetical protein
MSVITAELAASERKRPKAALKRLEATSTENGMS